MWVESAAVSEPDGPPPKPAAEFTDDQNAEFERMFGISRQELERRGIDRTKFIQENLPRLARSERRMRSVWEHASPGDRFRHESATWRLRSFYALFLALGSLLAYSRKPPGAIAIALIAVSCAAWIAAAIFGYLGARAYFAWLRARNGPEGEVPPSG